MTPFNGTFSGKRVLVTGHTGFKGTWLSLWLKKLGAEVFGISNSIPTNPSMFEDTGLELNSSRIDLDVRNFEDLSTEFKRIKPNFVFHLAAQAIVSESYANPLETIQTNSQGFTNILEVIRNYSEPLVAVMITSDKCYHNIEQLEGYKESDRLGGNDIYSASKASAEILFHAYYSSFFQHMDTLKIGTGRAGNVIGGGDWAKDRIVPDAYKAWRKNESLLIRSPDATRPWQHVLEPLSGYLSLADNLFRDQVSSGENFNFGPDASETNTVINLVQALWDQGSGDLFKTDSPFTITDNIPFHEAKLLKLDCEKAHQKINWGPTLNFGELTQMISEWYEFFFKNEGDANAVHQMTFKQLDFYESQAQSRNIQWTQGK